MTSSVEEARAVLTAYRLVMDASWPDLHPAMAAAAERWPLATQAELETELAGYLADTAQTSRVRVFWKLGPRYVFGGCNEHFARDAGMSAADLIGIDDFDKRLPWVAQAAKYRADDTEVYTTGAPKLDILERQKSAAGITWVLAGKAPIRTACGVIGILGMYEVLEGEAARKLFAERARRNPTA
jgi:hypothetical protein